MPGGAKICVHCEQRHLEALDAIAHNGKFMGECAECGTPAVPGQAMAVHYEGGKYRVNCLACDPVYVMKRRDLYGGTQYWEELGKAA
jgi:hypothetical protein